MNLDALLEAERRGILPEDKAAVLAEARRRGLVGGGQERPAPGPETWQAARDGTMPRPEVDTSAADRAADPTVRRGVAGFLFGDNDPNTMNAGEKFGTALNTAGESLTFGLVGDEAAAAADDLIGRGDYDERLQFYRDSEQQFADENPAAYTGAVFAPALMPAGAGARAVAAAPGLAGKIVTSGLLGAGGGGLYGFMEGEGSAENRVEDGVDAAAFSGAVGAAAPAVARVAGALARGMQGRRAGNAAIRGARSTDDLFADAADRYGEAQSKGVTATGEQSLKVADRAIEEMRKAGLVRPDGSLPSGYTKVKDALDTLMAYGDNAMTPEQMQNVRIELMEAARQPGNEGRIGRAFVQAFDDVMEPLAPQIKQGNELYARAKKGEMFERMAEEAKRKAGTNYTSAGYEHALRKEFSNLLGRINRGLEDGFSPDEVAAIKRVAEGGSVENFMRGLGKYTPSGPMSAFLSAGSGAGIGAAFGLSPSMMSAAGGGMWAAGAAGRMAATAMQRRNAEIAAALARSGANLPAPTASKVNPEILRALLAASAPTGMATTAGPQ